MVSPVKIWRQQRKIKDKLGKVGKVVSWTKIYSAPKSFKSRAPYEVVLVEFNNGERWVGQLVDSQGENLKIGQKVKGVLRKTREVEKNEVIVYGIKFKLLR